MRIEPPPTRRGDPGEPTAGAATDVASMTAAAFAALMDRVTVAPVDPGTESSPPEPPPRHVEHPQTPDHAEPPSRRPDAAPGTPAGKEPPGQEVPAAPEAAEAAPVPGTAGLATPGPALETAGTTDLSAAPATTAPIAIAGTADGLPATGPVVGAHRRPVDAGPGPTDGPGPAAADSLAEPPSEPAAPAVVPGARTERSDVPPVGPDPGPGADITLDEPGPTTGTADEPAPRAPRAEASTPAAVEGAQGRPTMPRADTDPSPHPRAVGPADPAVPADPATSGAFGPAEPTARPESPVGTHAPGLRHGPGTGAEGALAIGEVRAPGTGAVATGVGDPSPAPPPPLPTQLVSTVLPLRHRPDGTYRTVLELNPPELGRVQVEIRLHHGALSLHLRAEDDGTGALLRASAGELRAQLEAGGVRTGTLVVDLGGESLAGPFDRHDRERSGPDRGPTAPATQPPPEAAVAPRSPAPDTLVDVLL